MESLFPKPRGPVDFLYLVRRHSTRVEKVRVAEIGPRYVRVFKETRKFANRDSWKSLYHQYFYYYAQAKRTLEVDYETKMKLLQTKLDTFAEQLRSISMTNEEDL